MTKRSVAGLLCALVCGTPSADPVEEYRRACEAPHFEILSAMTHPTDATPFNDDDAWDAAEKSCAEFIRRIQALDDLSAESRLALLMAKYWLGNDERRCSDLAAIVERIPGNADALYEWSSCVDDEIPLLKRTVEMGHTGARRRLVSLFERTGDYYGIQPETLAQYAESFYQDANDFTDEYDIVDRYVAAKAIYMIALDTADAGTAKAIQDRLVHDHGLDSLDYDAPHRDESLERACDDWMFDIDLEERLCVPALEALAAESLARGEAIPSDVLRHMGDAFDESEAKAGVANPAGERIAAILVSHPEPLRSSEHLWVLAETTTPFGSPERVAGLRRAVEANPGNLRAQCDLADALAFTGAVDEAASVYKGLMAAEGAPCRAGDAFGRLVDRTEGEGVGEAETIHLR